MLTNIMADNGDIAVTHPIKLCVSILHKKRHIRMNFVLMQKKFIIPDARTHVFLIGRNQYTIEQILLGIRK